MVVMAILLILTIPLLNIIMNLMVTLENEDDNDNDETINIWQRGSMMEEWLLACLAYPRLLLLAMRLLDPVRLLLAMRASILLAKRTGLLQPMRRSLRGRMASVLARRGTAVVVLAKRAAVVVLARMGAVLLARRAAVLVLPRRGAVLVLAMWLLALLGWQDPGWAVRQPGPASSGSSDPRCHQVRQRYQWLTLCKRSTRS